MSIAEATFGAILLLRLLVPLAIPRFPLPGVLAALVIDGVDQTIFQQVTDRNLDWYQGYDKALDVYYLAIAYLSTLRNWLQPFAFGVALALWYYRLAGVLLFELTEVRALLLIFPNTFEYFFIALEGVRTMWNPERVSRRSVVLVAAGIWLFIKLPQEWCIHIAQFDVTDILKEDILGASIGTPWGTALRENPWFIALLAVLVVLVVLAATLALRRAPARDWGFTLDVDRHLRPRRLPESPIRIPTLSWYMAEKVALTATISIIFAQVLYAREAPVLQVAAAVAVVVVANGALSQVLVGRGHRWQSIGRLFVAMLPLNLSILAGYLLVLRLLGRTGDTDGALFFALLLTLILTLFDRYHQYRWHETVEQEPGRGDLRVPLTPEPEAP